MGTWGIEPWANDAAADWYDELFGESRLADKVEEMLDRDVADYCEEIRAAAHVVLLLGETFIWPTESRARCLRLAAGKLQAALDLRCYTNANLIARIKREIALLRARCGEST